MNVEGARPTWPLKFVLLALVWGSSFLLMKVGLAALAPLQIATARILTGAAVLLVLLRLGGGRLPREPRVLGHVLVCSLFLGPLPFTLFALSETRISSALAGIGNGTTPIASVLFSLLLLPAARPTPAKIAAVALGFAGVVVIAEPWSSGRPDPLGFAMALVAGVSYGLGWTWFKRHLGDVSFGTFGQPASVLLGAAVLSLPTLVGWWVLRRDELAAPWSLTPTGQHPVWLALLAVLVLGVVGTGLAYKLQADVVSDAGPVIATSVTYLIPVVSILLGVLLLGERLGPAQLGGFAVVLVAAVLIGRPPRRPRRRRPRAAAPDAPTPAI